MPLNTQSVLSLYAATKRVPPLSAAKAVTARGRCVHAWLRSHRVCMSTGFASMRQSNSWIAESAAEPAARMPPAPASQTAEVTLTHSSDAWPETMGVRGVAGRLRPLLVAEAN